MITIVAKRIVKEDQIESYIKLSQPLIEASRAEDGCISYSLYQDIKDPQALTFIECWRNRESIEAHNRSEHFMTILPQLAQLVEEKMDVDLYKEVQY